MIRGIAGNNVVAITAKLAQSAAAKSVRVNRTIIIKPLQELQKP